MMMRKIVLAVVAASFLSTSVWASKARLEALGQNAAGSQYIMDNRNIFLNAAHVNFHKDIVTFETGNAANEPDSAVTPRSEGGFLRSSGNLVYGVMFGYEDALNDRGRQETAAALRDANTNSWDFFIGGDAGIQWGASLSYSAFNDEQATNEVESQVVRSRFGIVSGNIEGFLNLTLADTAKIDTANDYKVKSAFDLGGSYNLKDMTYFLRYSSIGAEDSKIGSETFTETTLVVGAGKVEKINDKATLNYDISYRSEEMENDGFGKTDKVTDTRLALNVGFEVMVKEWLTLRGSMSQNLYGQEKNAAGKTKSIADTTNVFAGASLHFGDFQLDGLIGNSTEAGPQNATTQGGNGALRSDVLMSRLSATYRF